MPALRAAECHVWRFSLDGHAEHAEAWAATLLDDEERAAAERFRTDLLVRRYIVAHGALRHLLSLYGAGRPADIRFEREEWGRPWCRIPAEPDLQFSLSHCEDSAILAVARCRIGADLEQLRVIPEMSCLVRHIFGPDELRHFERLRPAAREGAFIRAWTLKEAFAKAIGEGLGFPLVEAEIAAGYPPAKGGFGAIHDRRGGGEWTAVALPPWAGFAASVAASAPIDEIVVVEPAFGRQVDNPAGAVSIRREFRLRPARPQVSHPRTFGWSEIRLARRGKSRPPAAGSAGFHGTLRVG